MAGSSNNNYTQIMDLPAGDYYFSVQYACRQTNFPTQGLRIYWNGQVIFDRLGTEIADYEIHTFSMNLVAVEGQNTLILEGTGTSDGNAITIDNVFLYAYDFGNWEEVNSTNGSKCQCQSDSFYDGVQWACTKCEMVAMLCQQCSYPPTNTTFNISEFNCTSCAEGYYPSGSSCMHCSTALAQCLNCSADARECYDCNQTANYFLNQSQLLC